MSDDELRFAAEEPEAPVLALEEWTILVVDDEPEVHAVTRMVLADVLFQGRRLVFRSAYSAAEARAMLASGADVAVILLDVVMETDQAGLDLVRFIRGELGNAMVRIILRTGQPGQAPERDVVVQYDINDYKEKAELTAPKLFTAVFSALRSYQDLRKIETIRRGLERIIAASGDLFKRRSMDLFLSGLLGQLNGVLDLGPDTLLCARHPDKPEQALPRILAATGRFSGSEKRPLAEMLSAEEAAAIRQAFEAEQTSYAPGHHLLFFHGENRHQIVIYVAQGRPLSEVDVQLVEVFCAKAAIGLDNVYLYEQLRAAIEATVNALAKAAEYKDDSTGAHVQRVSRYSTELARILWEDGSFPNAIDAEFISLIGLASVLHDVGKVGVPDGILKKPDRLTEQEWEFMHRHPDISLGILTEAAAMVDGRTYRSMGVEIAAAHHEHYDGNGYPHRLQGEGIPLSARILAVVDVFDALTSRRPYKRPWPVDEALAFIGEAANRQFDPVVAAAFLKGVRCGRIPVVPL